MSTVSQTLDQQDAALAAAGVTKTFSDTMSGAKDDRPGLAALLDYVREGDTVVVWKLDRLGRSQQAHLRSAPRRFATYRRDTAQSHPHHGAAATA